MTDEIERTLPLAKRAYRAQGADMRTTFTFFRQGLPHLSWVAYETPEDASVIAGLLATCIGADAVTITFVQGDGFTVRYIGLDKLTGAGWAYDHETDEFAAYDTIRDPLWWPNWKVILDHLGRLGAVFHENGTRFAASVLAHADERGRLTSLPAASSALMVAWVMSSDINDDDRQALNGAIEHIQEGLTPQGVAS